MNKTFPESEEAAGDLPVSRCDSRKERNSECASHRSKSKPQPTTWFLTEGEREREKIESRGSDLEFSQKISE